MDFDRLFFILEHYFAVSFFVAIAYIIGRRLLLKIKFDSGWEEFTFSSGIGIGVIIFITMILGFLQILHEWLIISVFIVILAVCYPVYMEWPERLRNFFRKPLSYWLTSLIFIPLLIFIVWYVTPILKIPMYPPADHDATLFHLPIAKYFSNWHGIRFTPYLRYPVFPFNMQMLYTLMLLFYDDVSAQTLHFIFLLLSSTAIIAWGKRLQYPAAGVLGAFLLLSSPHQYMFSSEACLDTGLTFFLTLGLYSFTTWIYNRDQRWLVLSGVFLGLSCGIKYTAIFTAILIFLATIVFDIRERKLRHAVIFGLVTFAVGIPWYIRNVIYTGNPVFPFMPGLFGYSLWDESDLARQMANLNSLGVAKDFINLFKVPFLLISNPLPFEGVFPYHKLWLYGLPAAIVMCNFKAQTRWLLGFILAVYVYWFYSSQASRYLDPAFPILGLCIGISVEMIIGYIPYARDIWRHPVTILIIAFLITMPGVHYAKDFLNRRPPIPLTEQERFNYLVSIPGKHYWTLGLYDYLNKTHGSDYRVYSINDTRIRYYADGVMVGEGFGIASKYKFVTNNNGTYEFNDVRELYRALIEDYDCDYLIINTSRKRIIIPADQYFTEHFREILTVKISGNMPAGVLYELIE